MDCEHEWTDCDVDVAGFKAGSGRACKRCTRIEFQLEEPYDEMLRGTEMSFGFAPATTEPQPPEIWTPGITRSEAIRFGEFALSGDHGFSVNRKD